jgi:dipeptidase E
MSKLFLYSLAISPQQADSLTRLVGKEADAITFALIENAADPVTNSNDWLGGFREMLRTKGYQLERIDLRHWRNKQEALRIKLASKDVIWIGGGHTYYLRWILQETGADQIIRELVRQGKVYAGWSAGAVMAGPTLKYFENMDDPAESPMLITEGLRLTNIVVVPHLDNRDFSEDARDTDQRLRQSGYKTLPLGDAQVLIINGRSRTII